MILDAQVGAVADMTIIPPYAKLGAETFEDRIRQTSGSVLIARTPARGLGTLAI